MTDTAVAPAPVVGGEEEPPKTLTRAEAYQYLTVTLDRLDRDVSVLAQGANANGELDGLWNVRKSLLDAQRDMVVARRSALVTEQS